MTHASRALGKKRYLSAVGTDIDKTEIPMKKATLMAAFLLAAVYSYGQQSIASDQVEAFNAMSVSGNISVELVEAGSNKVDIVLYDADITKFKWGVKNGTLNLSLSGGGKTIPRAEAKIYYADTLQYVSVSGGQITARQPLAGVAMRVDLSGGASAALQFDMLDLELNCTGNSVAEYGGISKYLGVRATEKSKVNARKLDCVSADVETATGAELTVIPSERLVVNAKTSSTVFYGGTPVVVKDRTSKMNSGMMGSSVNYIGEE